MEENIDTMVSDDEEERNNNNTDKNELPEDEKIDDDNDNNDMEEEEESPEDIVEDDNDMEEEEEEEEESPEDNIDEYMDDFAELPDELKALKACLSCSLVKTYTQFYNKGCDNCIFLKMTNDPKKVKSCTTSYFEGLIGLVEPQNSWVAKWQRIVQMKPGMYAIQVSGTLQDEEDMDENEDGIYDD